MASTSGLWSEDSALSLREAGGQLSARERVPSLEARARVAAAKEVPSAAEPCDVHGQRWEGTQQQTPAGG